MYVYIYTYLIIYNLYISPSDPSPPFPLCRLVAGEDEEDTVGGEEGADGEEEVTLKVLCSY